MTGETAELRSIGPGGGDEIEHYPFAPDLRLDTHHFFAFFHRRWLSSRMRLLATPEVRAYAIDLYALAQDQTPVGTLPCDQKELAALLNIDRDTLEVLNSQPIGPLYGWELCQCGGELRWAHPVVLEVIQTALSYQRKAAARSEAGNRRKRLNRLKTQMAAIRVPERLYSNDVVVEWCDDWLEQHCSGNRTAARVKEALEAHSASEFS